MTRSISHKHAAPSNIFDGFAPHNPHDLVLIAPSDAQEFTHEGIQFAYSPSTGKGFRHITTGWRAIKAGTLHRTYTHVGVNGFMQQFHRIIAQHFLNGGAPIPRGLQVDHIQHATGSHIQDTLDNLRIVTSAQNTHNSRVPHNNTSGFKGVSWYNPTKKWRARITLNGMTKQLGSFPTPEAAYIAYCTASHEYHGEHGCYDAAQLNRAIAAECGRMEVEA